MGTDRQRVTLEGSPGGPLQVERLEHDLATMWKSASDRAGGTAVSRACGSTLVALSCGADPDLDEWVQEISRHHPCRAIRVETASRGEAPLSASAGAVCHLRPGGEGLICAEEIRIQVREEALDRLPSAVRSLAVGDLPFVLFAPDPAARDGEAFSGILADADVAIVDSRRLDDLDAEGRPAVRDLAWSRGSALRRATALGVGGLPLDLLDGLREVRIAHGGDGPVPAAAHLLAGWLASRLGLVVSDSVGPERVLGREGDGGTIRLSFQRVPGPDDPLGLVLSLDGKSGVEVRLADSGRSARISGPDRERDVALRRRGRAERVIDEIHRHRPDPAYLASLPLARAIGGAGGERPT